MNIRVLSQPVKIKVNSSKLVAVLSCLKPHQAPNNLTGSDAFLFSILMNVVTKICKKEFGLMHMGNKEVNLSLTYYEAYVLHQMLQRSPVKFMQDDYYSPNAIRIVMEELNKQLV